MFSPKSFRFGLPGAALVLLVLLVGGCGGSDPAQRGATSAKGDFPGDVPQAESSFRPADYGVETWEQDTLVRPSGEVIPGADPAVAASPDSIPGVRVQVSITGDIDDANNLRDSLSGELPKEWVYVVYHAPYYKIRVGNFVDRFAAGEMLERLRRQGFPDAWIVPDRIVRNPPPKPAALIPDSTDAGETPR